MISKSHILETISAFEAKYRVNPSELADLRLLVERSADPTARTEKEGHVTCSAIVVSPNCQVLMVFHRALQRLLFPGGHVEPEDASLIGAALRELFEEVGLDSEGLQLVANGCPIEIDRHTIPDNPVKGESAHEHWDFRFAFRSSSEFPTASSSDEIEKILGVSIEAIADPLRRRLSDVIRE